MKRVCVKLFSGNFLAQPLSLRPVLAASLALFSLFLCSSARALDRDDRYLQIFDQIEQGDALSVSNKTAAAIEKYQQAHAALQSFSHDYPDYNPKMVAFRIKDLEDKLRALSQTAPIAGGELSRSGTGGSGSKSPAASSNAAATQVKLIQAGSEPHKPLRLHPKAGDKQTVTMTMKLSVETQAAGTALPAMKLPEMKMVMDVTVNSVSPEGDISYGLTLSDVSIAEDAAGSPLAEAMKSSMGGLKGATGAGTLSSRGIVKSSQMNIPASADPKIKQAADQLKDSLGHLVPVLPEEPVGPGASWEVKMPIKSEGLTINQIMTCKITSMEGDRLKTSVTVNQAAANQKIQNAAMPGIKMDLVKMAGTGSGTSEFDLGQVAALEVSSQMKSDMEMSMTMGAQKQAMTVKSDVDIHITGK